jgi:allantoinase
MDHGRYAWSNLFTRPAVRWPGDAALALWVVVDVEWHEFDQQRRSVQPLGSPLTEYPDLWGYTLLDYGNRVGVFRLMDALSERELAVTAAVNSEVAERYPYLVEKIGELGWEVIGHGRSGSELLHDGIEEAEERELIGEALRTLRRATGQPVRGWLSPSMSESKRTPDLLAQEGVEFICDWVNDDLPYEFRTRAGPLVAFPCSIEINDLRVIQEYGQTMAEFCRQIEDQCEVLLAEAQERGGRSLCIVLHPWVSGAPHRIRYIGEALDQIRADPRVWSATAGEIVDAFRSAVLPSA